MTEMDDWLRAQSRPKRNLTTGKTKTEPAEPTTGAGSGEGGARGTMPEHEQSVDDWIRGAAGRRVPTDLDHPFGDVASLGLERGHPDPATGRIDK